LSTEGTSVTLTSVTPLSTMTSIEAGFQAEFGGETRTVWRPMKRLMLIGVVFPVSTPSMATRAPDGKDVTFSAPLPDCAATAVEQNATSASPNSWCLHVVMQTSGLN